jgi:hypothetical protein
MLATNLIAVSLFLVGCNSTTNPSNNLINKSIVTNGIIDGIIYSHEKRVGSDLKIKYVYICRELDNANSFKRLAKKSRWIVNGRVRATRYEKISILIAF